MTNTEPLLSVVVVSRSDDHDGNLLQRMQLFVSGWLEQAKRYALNLELIIVEWNPLPDRLWLAQALKWPREAGQCTMRIIEIPSEIYQRFKYSDKLPVFQMIGKNVHIHLFQYHNTNEAKSYPHLEPGKYRVRSIVDNLQLSPGRYRLGIGVR